MVVWDTCKSYIRGRLLAFWAFQKKKRDLERVALTLLAQTLEKDLKQFPVHDVKLKFQLVYDEMKILDAYQIAQEVLYTNQILLNRSDNQGRILKGSL